MTENEEDEELSSIGFMFDVSSSKINKEIKFVINSQEISLNFLLIGEDPGHKQSGHYLWPAAQFLSLYLIENWNLYKSSSLIIELGAGIGICGIVCCYLNQFHSQEESSSISSRRSQEVILTDYDPGCIELLNRNIIQNHCELSCHTEYLKWGDSINHLLIKNDLERILVIGSDLLYCKGVVEPLFITIFHIFHSIVSKNGIFLLASSFDVGEVKETNSSIFLDLIFFSLFFFFFFLGC